MLNFFRLYKKKNEREIFKKIMYPWWCLYVREIFYRMRRGNKGESILPIEVK